MTQTLSRLIAEAQVLAGGEHQCKVLGHKWKSIGGRACPFHKAGCGDCSQEVNECESCGDVDYGDAPGMPGYDYCASKGFDCGGEAQVNAINAAHEERITSCRSCSARIVWFKTKTGKNMPVDAATVVPEDAELDLSRHKSHFATCPDAAKHRKPR